MECSFTVKRKELLSALMQFKKVVKSVKNKGTILEVTIIDCGLTLNIPGGEQTIQAQTKGSAKFAVKLWYIIDILASYDMDVLNCLLTEDTLKISNTFFNVYTTFFEDDNILRSINLPLNYSHVDLYRLNASGKYTQQEIEFNELTEKIEASILKIKLDTEEVSLILSAYGFSRKEITEIIMDKLKEGIPS
jgi:hypothetical protein